MASKWRDEARWAGGFLVLTVFAGYAVGRPGSAWLAFICGYLFWHLFQLSKLTAFLAAKTSLQRPFPPGIWGAVYEGVEALQIGEPRRGRLSPYLERLRVAVDALPEAIVLLSRDHGVEWANGRADPLLGISDDVVPGDSFLELVPHEALAEYLRANTLDQPLVTPSPKDDSVILEIRVTHLMAGNRSLLVARDITRVHHLEYSQSDFVSNVSHELRTPITVFKGYLETLIDGLADSPEWTPSLVSMQQQTDRMQDIVNDLLILSRMQMVADPEADEVIYVTEVLEDLVEDARALSGESKHRILLERDASLGLCGNLETFRSIASNLLFNAVLHTPMRTEIRILWQTSPDGAILVIKDDGNGISPVHIPRLTERFYRVDASRSRRTGGTGLGLAIAEKALERLGGSLEINSKVGFGTTFKCRLQNVVSILPDREPRIQLTGGGISLD